MRISYTNHWSAVVDPGDCLVIGTDHPQIFQDYVNGLLGDDDQLMICKNNYEDLKLSQGINFIGDLMFSGYDQMIKQFLKYHVDHLDINVRDRINQLEAQLLSQVQQSLYLSNVPLHANQNLKMENLFKLFKIGLDDDIAEDFYGIIEALIKMQLEINANVILVFVNLHQVLTIEQLQSLKQLCSNSEVGLIDVEFDDVNHHDHYGSSHIVYVDHDYLDWEFN